ncbi:hypothetical protein QEO94_05985 [Kingella negevensis]|uniref:hypothetical protein n=1 Tax=Kingella negevensis TaxID=1522312 RepID=UPI002543D7AD|nr:hypothetical protein [Kingella negevensis]WII92213.1 hypothetical protein QEO94_05985 [Kingella negevensis]
MSIINMDIFNHLNTIISVVAGIISIFSAIKAWVFKNETKDLQKKLLIQLEINDLIVNLNLCIDKISKLPYEYKRGLDLDKEIKEIQNLFHKTTSLAISQNTNLFNPELSVEVNKWRDKLSKYQRYYANTQNKDVLNKENISDILNSLQSEISSVISKCKQNI